MFRHCTAEFHLQIFDIALLALCADVVSPAGKQPGGYYPPLHGVCHQITERKFRYVNEVLKKTLY